MLLLTHVFDRSEIGVRDFPFTMCGLTHVSVRWDTGSTAHKPQVNGRTSCKRSIHFPRSKTFGGALCVVWRLVCLYLCVYECVFG
jgi:hypothetical protein